ncbi:MAG: small ribosomal subunit biogenesis GTPase RsgA [Snowella sp.]|nr:small ribosomal subunit biogenesis GTPase RsgA [Snowella sp.]
MAKAELGTVIAIQANFYQVRLDQSPLPLLLCTRRSRLKKIGQSVMVGDRVWIEDSDPVNKQGAIAAVEPRKNELSRPPVANADQILLVFSLAEPPLESWQLSRFLVKAESTDLDLCLCLNKQDLISPEAQAQWQERLAKWNYQPLFISIHQQQGIDQLLEILNNKITLMAGPSGVGKSSLINTLIPGIQQRVNRVSGKLQKGRHTTRHVELFELPTGGLLADTPGFNQPDLDIAPAQLIFTFPEARKQLETSHCQFNDCLHREEPHCVVRGDWERYEHYLKFLEESLEHEAQQQQTSDEESNLKTITNAEGQQDYEPKLARKKYRRSSRRLKHQALQTLYHQQSARLAQGEEGDKWD